MDMKELARRGFAGMFFEYHSTSSSHSSTATEQGVYPSLDGTPEGNDRSNRGLQPVGALCRRGTHKSHKYPTNTLDFDRPFQAFRFEILHGGRKVFFQNPVAHAQPQSDAAIRFPLHVLDGRYGLRGAIVRTKQRFC